MWTPTGSPVCCGCLRWVELLGAGLAAGSRQSRALGSCSPWAAVDLAGLSRSGCLRDGFDLGIGSDGFFDHTGWEFLFIRDSG